MLGHAGVGSSAEAPSVNNVNTRKPRPKTRKKKVKKPVSSPDTSASPAPTQPEKGPPSDPLPRYKAEFNIAIKVDSVGKRRIQQRVVADTGCSKSAISEEFFLASPHFKTRPYRPLTTRGTAINGSKVMTMGF